MIDLDYELRSILDNTEYEEDPVTDSIIIPSYSINSCEISKDAYYYIMDLIKKDLKDRNIIAAY